MYSVTLNWTKSNIDWCVCDIKSSIIVKQGEKSFNKNVLGYKNYSLIDVVRIFERSIFKNYPENEIDLVMLIVPVTFPLLYEEDIEDTFIRRVEKYFEKHNIYNVKLLYSPFFDATRALIELTNKKKSFKVGDEILTIQSSLKQPIDPLFIGVIHKTKAGWRLELKRYIDPQYYFFMLVPEFMLKGHEVELNKIQEMVIFHENMDQNDLLSLFSFYDADQITPIDITLQKSYLNTVKYLSNVYTNNTTDFNYYVPVTYHWVFNIDMNPSCSQDNSLFFEESHKNVLPYTHVINQKIVNPLKSCTIIRLNELSTKRDIIIPTTNANFLNLKLIINNNGCLGIDIKEKNKSEYHSQMEYQPSILETLYPKIMINKDNIQLKYWNDTNGILTNVSDVNGLTLIPLKISFNSDDGSYCRIPIIGSAVNGIDDYSLKHNIIDLFNNEYINDKINDKNTENFIRKTKNNSIKIIIKTSKGYKRIEPIVILSTIIKSMIKLYEQKTNKNVEGIKLIFHHSINYQIINNIDTKKIKKLLNINVI